MNSPTTAGKNFSTPMLICSIIAYLAIIQGSNHLLTADRDYGYASYPDTESIIRSTTIPVALSALFVIGLISWLGWWKKIMRDSHRLKPWTWLIPTLMLLSILVVTNYPLLRTVSPIMILTLLASVLLIGIGEELMFRGITLETMRRLNHTTELKAALFTALIFGGVHISNIFTEGPGAFFQAGVASASGLLLYVCLRVSGSLWLPIMLHAGWDFSLFSSNLGNDPKPYLFSPIALLLIPILTIIVWIKWRSIWPSPPRSSA